MTQFGSQNGNMQACIDQCLRCYEVCTRTLATGLEINEDQEFITALQLCAQSCQLAAQAMLLDSNFHGKTCALCADLCEQVAEMCQDFDEEEIRACGRECEECARVCRSMSAHAVSQQSLQPDIRLV